MSATDPLAPSRGPCLCSFDVKVEFAGPLQIASGERLSPRADIVLLRDISGALWLPGSSVRGALRDFATREARLIGVPKDAVTRLFGDSATTGNNDRQGRLTVLDALVASETSGIRDHVAIDPKTGAAKRGAKFDDEVAFPESATLRFRYEGKSTSDPELTLLNHTLTALSAGLIPLGAKKGWGYGSIRNATVTPVVTNRSDPGRLAAYLSNRLGRPASANEPEPKPSFTPGGAGRANADEPHPFHWLMLELELQFDGPFVVAGPIHREASAEEKFADTVPYRDPSGASCLPGSSLRGVLRAHSRKIERQLGLTGLCDVLFGAVKGQSGQAGLVRVDDAIVDPDTPEILMDHVAIDRITGFSVVGALFQVVALQSPKYTVSIKLRWRPEHTLHAQAAALLLFALRDASKGLLWAGSRTTRGYGHLRDLTVKTAQTWLVETGPVWSRAPQPALIADAQSIADLQEPLAEAVFARWPVQPGDHVPTAAGVTS